MNTFSKFFLLVLGVLIGIAGVLQLQQVAFDLLSAADDVLFYLGLFYLALVIFIWVGSIYAASEYVKKLTKEEESCTTCKCGSKKVSNKTKTK
jgi:uncharacterized membrane protein YcjF (UPF0283 family)